MMSNRFAVSTGSGYGDGPPGMPNNWQMHNYNNFSVPQVPGEEGEPPQVCLQPSLLDFKLKQLKV
jgi:hypothetical protein